MNILELIFKKKCTLDNGTRYVKCFTGRCFVKQWKYQKLVDQIIFINEHFPNLKIDIPIDRLTGSWVPLEDYQNLENSFRQALSHTTPAECLPATGEFRQKQLDILQIAKTWNDILSKQGINILLDWGSLLGAVRHGGFIPWDDDMDFSVLRPDFERMLDYLRRNLPEMDVSNYRKKRQIFEDIPKFAASCKSDFFWMRRPQVTKIYANRPGFPFIDFFPVDQFSENTTQDSFQQEVNKIKALSGLKCGERLDAMDAIRKASKVFDPNGRLYSIGPENPAFPKRKFMAIPEDKVLPFNKIKFEDSEFTIVNNPTYMLTAQYGRNYMGFPSDMLFVKHLNEIPENY